MSLFNQKLSWALFSLCALALWFGAPARAAEYTIQMLSNGPAHMMQFEPELLKIARGDTVHFTPTDPGHSVQSISGMVPAGVTPFKANIGEALTVTLTTEGVYGYNCMPHSGMGMVGLIVVGKPVNEDSAKTASVPGLAKKNFAKLFEQLDSSKVASR
jgi:pseudoazurin